LRLKSNMTGDVIKEDSISENMKFCSIVRYLQQFL
jgi:hypothetical protein